MKKSWLILPDFPGSDRTVLACGPFGKVFPGGENLSGADTSERARL